MTRAKPITRRSTPVKKARAVDPGRAQVEARDDLDSDNDERDPRSRTHGVVRRDYENGKPVLYKLTAKQSQLNSLYDDAVIPSREICDRISNIFDVEDGVTGLFYTLVTTGGAVLGQEFKPGRSFEDSVCWIWPYASGIVAYEQAVRLTYHQALLLVLGRDSGRMQEVASTHNDLSIMRVKSHLSPEVASVDLETRGEAVLDKIKSLLGPDDLQALRAALRKL